MSEHEKTIAENLVRACELLSEDKREYLIGYAEGVAAMAAKKESDKKEATNNDYSVDGPGSS